MILTYKDAKDHYPYAFYLCDKYAIPEYVSYKHGKTLVNHAVLNGLNCDLVHRGTGEIIDGYRVTGKNTGRCIGSEWRKK